MVTDSVDIAQLKRIREYLLTNDRDACVQRELWTSNGGHATYLALRNCIISLRMRGLELGHATSANAPNTARAPPTTTYSFAGMRAVFDGGSAAVTALAFAKVRSDLLAYGDAAGELWFARMGPAAPSAPGSSIDASSDAAAAAAAAATAALAVPTATKAPRIHHSAIVALDWSFDNSQLLTGAGDGLAVWDVATAAPIRTIMLARGGGGGGTGSTASVPGGGGVKAARFCPLNFNLVLVGTAAGTLEVYNCSAGTLLARHQVAGAFQRGLMVTALEVSNQSVFVGDSTGTVHLWRAELGGAHGGAHGGGHGGGGAHSGASQGAHARLVWQTKLRVGGGQGGDVRAPVVGCQYVPFCAATDSPLLLVTSRAGMLALVRVHEGHQARLEMVATCGVPPMARDIAAAVCPLSAISELPRAVMGAEDTQVYIYNLSATRAARNASGVASSLGALLGGAVSSSIAGLGGGAAAGGGTNRPMVVVSLKGHRAPVACVSWDYSESLLASADAAGVVIVWGRAT